MRRPLFYVQVRLGDGPWGTFTANTRLHWALKSAERALSATFEDGTRVFRHVRLRYRGLTLERWRGGCAQ